MPYPFRLSSGTARHLGLVVLQSDETIEQDFRRLVPAEAALLVTRVPSGREVTPDSLKEMENHIAGAAGLFPRGLGFDVVGYGCTSGTSVIGRAKVAELVRAGTEARAVTEPVSALIAACAELGVARIGFLSPYVELVSDRLRAVLAEAGIDSPAFGSFEVAEEAKVTRIDGASIIDAALDIAARGGIDALFLSCTNLRTLDVIESIEARAGLPVLSSNQVLTWHMTRLAGLPARADGMGRLWRL